MIISNASDYSKFKLILLRTNILHEATWHLQILKKRKLVQKHEFVRSVIRTSWLRILAKAIETKFGGHLKFRQPFISVKAVMKLRVP